MTYEAVTADMIQALDEEIAAIKKDGGGHQVALQAGIRQGFVAGRFLYAFVLTLEVSVLDDTPAQLKVGNKSYDVTVIAVEGFEISIGVTQDLGERVPMASLSMAPYYLLELLKKRLEEILSGELSADKTTALRLFNLLANQQLSPGPVVDFPPIQGRLPNPEQRQAVERAVSQRITFIWGPPGTGKTTTINYLVPALMKRGDRVFITSHTNVAVDAVLEASVHGFTPEELKHGAVVRIGQNKEHNELIGYLLLDSVVERRSGDLRSRQAHTEASLVTARQEFQRWSGLDRDLKRLEEWAQRSAQAHSDLASAQGRRLELQRQLWTAGRECISLEQQLQQAKATGFFRRLVTGLNPERIAANLRAAQGTKRQLETDLREVEAAVARAQGIADAADHALEAARVALAQTAALPTPDRVAAELRRSGAEVKRLESDLAAIAQQLAAVAAAVVREARVIGATLSKLATTGELYRTTFDTVIIDEASMIPQPHVWFAGSLAVNRVIVLGDFRQLPPISVAQSPVAKRRMSIDIFSEANIVDQWERVQHGDQRLATLNRQYRMHPDIGELANILIYAADGNPLEHCADSATLSAGLQSGPEPGAALVLCDTSAANPWCARLEPTFSRYNIYSALVAIRLAKEAVRERPGLQVGIMSPYSAQARLLQTLAKQYELGPQVQVATVHRFQGNQKDIIIVDLVDGPPFPPGQLLKDEKACRLLNVAFTRAKGKLVLVSNCDFFDGHRTGEAVDTAHAYFGGTGRSMDSRSILAGYGDEVLAVDRQLRHGQPLGNPEGASCYHEGTFNDAFMADLESAARQVVIFSPFIRAARTARLVPVLRHLLDKGVEIHLLTRAESGQEGSDKQRLIDELRDLGVTVSPRKGLHEKLAFIDERIAWTGSLNILSQSQSTEQMVRFANPEFAARLLEFSGVAGLLRQRRRQAQRQDLLERLVAAIKTRMRVPDCPTCGRPMVLRTGSAGPFFGCTGYPQHCKGVINVPRPTLKAAVDDLDITCPGCGQGKMRLKWSAKGPFLGCDRYPEDKTTMPLS